MGASSQVLARAAVAEAVLKAEVGGWGAVSVEVTVAAACILPSVRAAGVVVAMWAAHSARAEVSRVEMAEKAMGGRRPPLAREEGAVVASTAAHAARGEGGRVVSEAEANSPVQAQAAAVVVACPAAAGGDWARAVVASEVSVPQVEVD